MDSVNDVLTDDERIQEAIVIGEKEVWVDEPEKTLRDEFAIEAMKATLGNSDLLEEINATADERKMLRDEWLAFTCYRLADKMLKARAG